jgi:hypothetical protein
MNTPLNAAPISGRDGLPQPTVATIGEEEDEAEGGNPASVLARVSRHFSPLIPCDRVVENCRSHPFEITARTPLCSA